MRASIVTASDEGYFPTVVELLDSLEGIERLGSFSIHVLDVGLNEAQQRQLAARGCALVVPGWDVDVSRVQGVPGWFRAMTARPFLPSYVRETDLILWIDGDVWVQDQEMLYDFVRAARAGRLAVCPEMDRCYDNVFLRNSSREVYYGNLTRYFGRETAETLVHLPMLNCGVFALPADSPFWSLWQDAARAAARRYCSNFLEQTAFNVAVYTNRVTPHFLPARYNWMTCHAIPAFDEGSGRFVEPQLPHDRIGLVHLACGMWKRGDILYRTTDGRVRIGPLRPQPRSARPAAAHGAPGHAR